MNELDMVSVRVGGLRIGGFIGHGLYMVSRTGSWLVHNRPLRRTSKFVLIVAVLSLGIGHVLRMAIRANYENALKSPVVKDTYVVEDVRGLGGWMVVRTGTTHLKLKCLHSEWVDDKDSAWKHFDTHCTQFKPGDKIKLEKWESNWEGVTYVHKMEDVAGEDEYMLHKGDD